MRAILISIPFFIWGIFSINASLESVNSNPMIGGAFSILIGILFFVGGVVHLIDKKWPIFSEPEERGLHAKPVDVRDIYPNYIRVRPFTADELRFVGEPDKVISTLYTDEQIALLKELNTPDPNLVHPDDAKRQRLNIKV